MDLSYSINIEKVVLSSIIFSPDEIYFVSGFLEIQDFYLPVHQEIYKIMLELHKDNYPIDEDFIRKRAHGKNINDDILIEILSVNPITNVEAYCIEIKEDSKIRKPVQEEVGLL